MQAEAPGRRREPGTGPLGPLDQDRVAFSDQSFPVEVARLVGGPEAVAIEMEYRPAPPAIAMDQGIGRTGGRASDSEAARDGLDERGLARSQVALEREHGAGRQRPAEVFALGLELLPGELADHAWRRSLGAEPRRTSGAAMALRSLS